MIEYHSSSRRQGKTHAMLKALAASLKQGETVLIATEDTRNRDQIMHALGYDHGVEVTCEQVMVHTPMRVILDVNDPSPEPGIVGIDYGHEVRFGFKLKMKKHERASQ